MCNILLTSALINYFQQKIFYILFSIQITQNIYSVCCKLWLELFAASGSFRSLPLSEGTEAVAEIEMKEIRDFVIMRDLLILCRCCYQDQTTDKSQATNNCRLFNEKTATKMEREKENVSISLCYTRTRKQLEQGKQTTTFNRFIEVSSLSVCLSVSFI